MVRVLGRGTFIMHDVNINDSKIKMNTRVEIYKNDELLYTTENLIVLTGRNWLMQRVFNMDYDSSNTKSLYTPRWFALGGGSTSPDMLFQPLWPSKWDKDVWVPLNFAPVRGPKHNFDRTKKLIDNVTFTGFTTAQLTLMVDTNELSGCNINEAAIFVSDDDNDTNDFVMFSHVTFPTFHKSAADNFKIMWYYLF